MWILSKATPVLSLRLWIKLFKWLCHFVLFENKQKNKGNGLAAIAGLAIRRRGRIVWNALFAMLCTWLLTYHIVSSIQPPSFSLVSASFSMTAFLACLKMLMSQVKIFQKKMKTIILQKILLICKY